MTKPRLVTAFGEARTVKEWALLVGTGRVTLMERLREPGADPEECITRPIRAERRNRAARERVGMAASVVIGLGDRVEVAGTIRTVADWCELGSLQLKLVRDRVLRGVPLARAVSMPRPGPATLTAHGLTHTLEQWSTRCGVPVGTLKSRMRTRFAGEGTWTDEHIVSTPFTPTNKRQGPKYQVEPGAPDSISWEVEPWATDPVAQEMVRKNPGGMLVEAVCAATGLRDSQCRQVEATALHKLRVAALSGDRAALEFLGSMTGDTRDVEELIDIMAENFPRADSEALAALEDMEALAHGRLEVEPSNDNGMEEELAQLGYASGWA